MYKDLQKSKVIAKFLAKKLMKMVRRQPDIKLKDIQDVVHEKYVVHISAGS